MQKSGCNGRKLRVQSEAEKCPHLTVSTVFEDADLEWLTKLYLGLTDSLRIDS